MKWLILAVGLGSVWWLLRQMGMKRRQADVSAEWMREQSYCRKGY